MAESALAAHHRGKVRVALGRGSDFFGPGVLASALGKQAIHNAITDETVNADPGSLNQLRGEEILTASAEYTEYVLELLAPIGPVRAGRFFGGVGISNGSGQFAMIMGNSLYFAVDEDTRTKYEQEGMQAFSYLTKKGRVQVRKYFELPEDVLTDPEQLRLWASEAMHVAGKTKKASKAR